MTREQVDNKWKSLLKRFRNVEDHNSKSGNSRMPEDVFHEDMFSIMGEKASTRPRTVAGSRIEVRLEEEDSAVMPNTPRPKL